MASPVFAPPSPPTQLSNVEVITAYLFGSKGDGKALPVARQFDEDMAGGWPGRAAGLG